MNEILKQRKIKESILKLEYLKSILKYDPDTGFFIWLVKTNNKTKLNCRAGYYNKNGYVSISLLGKSYLAHRLAWFYINGYWPKNQIDHKNGIRDDNRFSNLREASHSENMHNHPLKITNTSGFKGVSYRKDRKKWRARCLCDGKNYYVGLFDSPQEAAEAMKEFREKIHGDFANHG